jgi:glucose-1-phosphate cytidylyltransferase
MKAVILAGGLGSRLSEETETRPKPMVEIGGRPILWHIMKIYSHVGINDFIICLGYKGYFIKDYFRNYALHNSDVTIDIAKGTMEVHQAQVEPWRVTLVETGDTTETGGRLKRVMRYLGNDDAFCFTYGDGVGNVDLRELIALHRHEGRLATVTVAQPPGRFGSIRSKGNAVTGFQEKPVGDGGWINAGFFVLSPGVADYITGDDTVWEREPMEQLARCGQMTAHFHNGFWHPMDTLRDKRYLERLWKTHKAQWKVW